MLSFSMIYAYIGKGVGGGEGGNGHERVILIHWNLVDLLYSSFDHVL